MQNVYYKQIFSFSSWDICKMWNEIFDKLNGHFNIYVFNKNKIEF